MLRRLCALVVVVLWVSSASAGVRPVEAVGRPALHSASHSAVSGALRSPSGNVLVNADFEGVTDPLGVLCGSLPVVKGNWTSYTQTNAVNQGPSIATAPLPVHSPAHSAHYQTSVLGSCTGGAFYQDFDLAAPASYDLTVWIYPKAGTQTVELLNGWDHGNGSSSEQDGVDISPEQTLLFAFGQTAAGPALIYKRWHKVEVVTDAIRSSATLKIDGAVVTSTTPGGAAGESSLGTVFLGHPSGYSSETDDFFYDDVSVRVAPVQILPLAASEGSAFAHVTSIGAAFEGAVDVAAGTPSGQVDVCTACQGANRQANWARIGANLPAGTNLSATVTWNGSTYATSDKSTARVRYKGDDVWFVGWDLDHSGTFSDVMMDVWGAVEDSQDPFGTCHYDNPPSLQDPGGHVGAWDKANLTYAVVGSPPDLTAAATRASLAAAFAEWQAHTIFRFKRVSPASSPDIIIRFQTAGYTNLKPLGSSDWQAHIGSDGVIHPTVTIPFNARAFWTTDVQPFPLGRMIGDGIAGGLADPRIDLQSAALHEIGHSLGATHSCRTDQVMYWSFDGSKRNVGSEDLTRIFIAT